MLPDELGVGVGCCLGATVITNDKKMIRFAMLSKKTKFDIAEEVRRRPKQPVTTNGPQKIERLSRDLLVHRGEDHQA